MIVLQNWENPNYCYLVILRCKTNSYPWNSFCSNKGQLFWQLSNKIIHITDLSETEQNLIKSSKCVQLPVTLKFHF